MFSGYRLLGFVVSAAALVLSGLFVPPGVATATGQLPGQQLLVSVEDAADPVGPNAEVVYVVEVANVTGSAVTDLTIAADTPAGTYFGEASTNVGTIEAPAQRATGRMVVRVPSLAYGQVARVQFVLGSETTVGDQLVFDVIVTTASRPEVELVEPTFVTTPGDPILQWEQLMYPPTVDRGGPRMLRVERPDEPFILPIPGPLEPSAPGLEYRLYRSGTPEVDPASAELVATLPGTQQSTGTLTVPGFYAVTAVFGGRESQPSNAVSFGRGEAVVDSVRLADGKLVATGTGFAPGLKVTVDGHRATSEPRVRAGSTKVVVSGKLSNGMKLPRYLKRAREALVCFESPDGSVACFRYRPLGLIGS